MGRMVAEMGSIIGVAASWWIAFRAYPTLPARFPTHFGFTGRPDGWGRREFVWLMPAISLVMVLFDCYLLNLVASDPRHPEMVGPVAWLNFEVLLMFLYIEERSIAVARGRAQGLGKLFVLVVIAGIGLTSLLLTRS